MQKENTMTEGDIERAYIIMAKIVRNHGDKYMPVFQRMHEIKDSFKAQQDLKNIALQIAQISLD